jgi:hypothetical protein
MKLLGRRRRGYEYDFPYAFVMVAGAAATYFIFKTFPQVERLLKTVYP